MLDATSATSVCTAGDATMNISCIGSSFSESSNYSLPSFSFFSSRQYPSSCKKKNSTEVAVGPFLRRGSCVGFAIWVLGLLWVYLQCPPESFQYLPATEWNTNMAVLIVLVSTNISRFIHLIIRDKTLVFVNTGIMVGSMMVQMVAIISITLMIALPTPVLVDPVTGLRTHMVRWVEWTVLAFLMTFLTESIDMPGTNMPWIHGIAIGLSTACGGIFPFCPSWTSWLAVFAVSWTLFMSLFVRLYQRYERFSIMKQPKESSMDETQLLDYERAKYSLKAIAICAFVWTLLAATYSVIAISRKFVPADHFLSSESLILVAESFFEIISKVWYFNILVEVHNIVFDDASRTMRRLEELRVVMSTIWNTSSDVMVWCSIDDDKIHAVVSPSFFDWKNPRNSEDDLLRRLDQKQAFESTKKPTLILEIDPLQGTYVHHILNLKLDSTITREDAVDLMMVADASQRNDGLVDQEENKDEKMTEEPADGNIAVLAGLLTRVFQLPGTEFVLMESNFQGRARKKVDSGGDGSTFDDDDGEESTGLQSSHREHKGDHRQLHCEAKISKVDSSCLVVLRDISERFQRFETEKKLVEEITARKKDAEANRFTRHEVKNSILACIGVLESMRVPSKEVQLPTQPTIIEQDEECDHPILPTTTRNSLHQTSDSISSTTSGIMDYLSFEEHAGELDSTLRTVLETIMDHAMSREVIYEEYELRKERIMVPDVLWNIRRCATSTMGSRFTLQTFPSDFPILGMDPRLLRYIYQNALSNSCRYGERNGAVETSIYYEDTLKEFRLEVVNLPGSGHQNLLELSHDEVQERVFAPRSQLHPKHGEDREMTASNSSGDGAWIMSKCARMLRGGCELRFQPDRTVFSFWCPAKAYTSHEHKEPELLALPEDTWGVVIDDSGIQRKLMDRYLKIAGIDQSRRVVVGGSADEIYGFSDMVVDLVKSHPESKFLIIADENLDVLEGNVMHGSVSGSMCLQKILERLDDDDSCRVLALVRSANDSAKETDLYKTRAHGYLVKAPIDKHGVLKSIQPWWFRRFASLALDDSIRSDSSAGSVDLDDYDPFMDIKAALEVLNALSMTSFASLIKRWRSIQDRLQALKGDLKSTIPSGGPDLRIVIQRIDALRSGGCPDSLREDWLILQRDIEELLERRRANCM